jgi:hypothetical protein
MNEVNNEDEYWKKLLKEDWFRLLPFLLVIIAAFFSGIYVFLWHNEIGLGFGSFWTYTFNDWSFGLLAVYIVMLIVRELLLVGLPTLGVLGLIFIIIWFTLAPEKREEFKVMSKKEEEKEKKRRFEGRGKKAGAGGGGFGGLTTVVFLIIMAVNGKWDAPFGTMDLQYFVATYLWAMLWVAVVCGIPALIVGIYFFRRWLK